MEQKSKTPLTDAPAPGEDDAAHRAGHGIPEDIADEEPKGTPTSDRHHSEIAPAKK